jgi:two-component sensor histidine kinase
LRWEETGGPPVVKPKQMGFGSYLIENGLPDAVVECEFQPSGFTCEIEAPLLGTSSDEHALKR